MTATELRRDGHRWQPTRRKVLQSALISIAAGWAASRGAGATSTPIGNDPSRWRTWLLDSADELRPAAPPAPSRAELDELNQLQRQRTVETAREVEFWGRGPAVLPWTGIALDLSQVYKLSPVRTARALALLQTTLHDAVVACWDAKAAYPRPAPATLDRSLTPLDAAAAGLSTFPSEHAAVAGAAASVLAYLFPDERVEDLDALADEAANSRLWAATNVRSDIEAGMTLGRAVGERAIELGKADGSDAMWDGAGRMEGPGFWQPTPPDFRQEPVDPMAGTWRTWVLARGDAYRPTPPPAWDSPAWHAELQAVKEAIERRTPEQEDAARFWAGGPSRTTPAGLWTEIARDLVVRNELDLPHAARAFALVTTAMADAFICCWDAKYAYWSARPITAEPELDVLIPTPPFPSYTSGHSTVSAAAAAVLGHLFPEAANDLSAKAEEAKNSRLWAGIHFPIDNEMGATGGGMVGRLVISRALEDGAE